MSAARLECWSLMKVCIGPPNSLSMLIEWEMTSTSSDAHPTYMDIQYTLCFHFCNCIYIIFIQNTIHFYRIQYILSYYIKIHSNPTIGWMLPRATMLSVLARQPYVTCWKEWFCWAWVRLRLVNNPAATTHLCAIQFLDFCLYFITTITKISFFSIFETW